MFFKEYVKVMLKSPKNLHNSDFFLYYRRKIKGKDKTLEYILRRVHKCHIII